jgi:hypothetical protein
MAKLTGSNYRSEIFWTISTCVKKYNRAPHSEGPNGVSNAREKGGVHRGYRQLENSVPVKAQPEEMDCFFASGIGKTVAKQVERRRSSSGLRRWKRRAG